MGLFLVTELEAIVLVYEWVELVLIRLKGILVSGC